MSARARYHQKESDMGYEWTEDLATSIVEIDDQHKELFARFNALLDACRLQKGKEEIAEYLQFLETYVVKHFSAEEKKMKERGYPGLSAHQAEHREFMGQMDAIKKESRQYGTGINVVLMAIRTSGDWLVNHIRKTDKTMAAHLRAAEPA
jgi:hemerythrin